MKGDALSAQYEIHIRLHIENNYGSSDSIRSAAALPSGAAAPDIEVLGASHSIQTSLDFSRRHSSSRRDRSLSNFLEL